MKTLVIIISILAVMTVVYAIDEMRLRNFYDLLKKCRKENGVKGDTLNSEVALCATAKEGIILDAKGEVVKEAANKAIRDFISDANRREKAQNIYNKCQDEVDKSGVTGLEQATKISLCAWPIINLLDKL